MQDAHECSMQSTTSDSRECEQRNGVEGEDYDGRKAEERGGERGGDEESVRIRERESVQSYRYHEKPRRWQP